MSLSPKRLIDRVYCSPGMPNSAVSMGTVTWRSISSADHAGFCVMNSTSGGEGSGYASMSSRTKA